MKKPIYQHDFWYGFLRNYVSFYLYLFYDRVTVIGKTNVPKDKPVIFAINHQNALMDALTVLLTLGRQPVFMARADIFQSKVVAKILRFLKILPIYRIRDGIKNLQNNDAVFEEAVGVLQAGKSLGILPEGNHFGERRLRILKKGIARIAFQAEERNNFNLDIQIVPVGLDYTHYINFGADLLVQFGKPFALSSYYDVYKENPQKGMAALLAELKERMTENMLNIDDTDHYEEIEALKNICINHLLAKHKLRDHHIKILHKSQEITHQLIDLKNNSFDKFEKLGKDALQIKDEIKATSTRFWVPAYRRFFWGEIVLNYLLLLILAPFAILGFVINFLPFYIPVIATRKIKDPQFVSSVRFVASILTFTLFYLIYIILLFIYTPHWYCALGTLVGFLISGILSFRYYIGVKKTLVKTRVNIWKLKKDETWLGLVSKWNETIDKLSAYISL